MFNVTNYENITLYDNGSANTTKTNDKITITTGSNSSSSGFYILKNNLISYIDNYNETKIYNVSMDIKASREITMQIGCDTRPNIIITDELQRINITTLITGGFIAYSKMNTANDVIEISNIMITENEPYTYIPYGKYGIEVKATGKNLFDKSAITENYYYSPSGQYTSVSNTYLSDYIEVTEDLKYTFQTSNSSTTKRVNFFNNEKVWQSQVNTNNADYTFTIPSNIKYIRISFNSAVDKDVIQIEKGNTVTTYEPYKSTTYLYTLDNPLRSIGDTKDLLYIKNGILYVERKIGSIVLDGTQGTFSMPSTNRFNIDNAFIDYLKSTNKTTYSSNYYEALPQKTSNADFNSIVGDYGFDLTSASSYTIRFKNKDITSIADFKSWLSTHNTEVQYILAEPYTEALGQVDMPSIYDGVTYIDIFSNINTYSYLKYSTNKSQVEAILEQVNQFSIDSFRTGIILGNPAIDGYDLIQITDNNKIFKTLATSELIYNGVLINKFDTQIGEEAKEKNVFINGDATFKKWAKTSIDNVKGDIILQAGEIDETKGLINQTSLQISSQGALLNVLANKSNINVNYDNEGNPIDGNVTEVTTTTGFTFNAEGMTIQDSETNFKALHRNTGTFYMEGDNIVGQYTKDGSKQKDMELFGIYSYGKNDFPDAPMFIAQLYRDENGEECFGHFYNGGDY